MMTEARVPNSEAPSKLLPIRQLLAEATRALALLDADRLEELAASVRTRSQSVPPGGAMESGPLAREFSEVPSQLAQFERTLAATRANLEVVRRTWGVDIEMLEYRPAISGMSMAHEEFHGND